MAKKKAKKPRSIKVSQNGDGMVAFIVADIEPGQPRFVGKDGELYASCKAEEVIHISVAASVNASLVKHGLADKFEYSANPTNKELILDDRGGFKGFKN
ncbi:hypothetical protein ACFLZK_02655 [Patescibacteria group bacterium]